MAMTGNPLVLRETRSTAGSSTFSVDTSFLLLFRPVSGCYRSKMGADSARCVRHSLLGQVQLLAAAKVSPAGPSGTRMVLLFTTNDIGVTAIVTCLSHRRDDRAVPSDSVTGASPSALSGLLRRCARRTPPSGWTVCRR